jgi:hypothetical protein
LDTLSLTDETILSGFTEDLEPNSYIQNMWKDLTPHYINTINKDRGDFTGKKPFTMETIREAIQEIVLNVIDQIHQERLRIRKHTERLQTIEEMNNGITFLLKDQNTISHTFKELTMDVWEQNSPMEFLMHTKDQWLHYNIDVYGKVYKPCYNGMPSSFSSYYEEGKVPFLTKCPKCAMPTKLNYLDKVYMYGDFQKSNAFYEVYCDKHYFYDCNVDTHYICNPEGQANVNIYRPAINMWGYKCWNPSKDDTKWSVWDPSDPDGTSAEKQKREQEIKDIQLQIEEYQNKIDELNKNMQY